MKGLGSPIESLVILVDGYRMLHKEGDKSKIFKNDE